MAQYNFTAGNIGFPLNKLTSLASEYIAVHSNDLSRMGGPLTTQETDGVVKLYQNLNTTLNLYAGLRWRASFKTPFAGQVGAIAIDGFTFDVESIYDSGNFNKSVTIYLPAALASSSGVVTIDSNYAINNLFVAARYSRINCTFDIIRRH